MTRSGSFFVALCMVAIAVSASVLAFTLGAVEAGASAAIGFALLLAMVIGHFGAQLAAHKAASDLRLAELARVAGDAGRDLAALAERVERFEAVALDQARTAVEPVAAEIGELGALVKQFAETLQVHEVAIVQATARPLASQPVPAAEPAAAPVQASPPAAPVREAAPPPAPVQVLQRQAAALRRQPETRMTDPDLPAAFDGLSRADAIAIIDEAISARRYELFLQPIVTLPQRKVRSYQASARLRTAEGQVLLAEDYRPLADDAGLTPALDSEIIDRCIQIVRRLTARNRDVSLVCEVSGAALADAAFAAELLASLEASRAVAGSLVLGFSQQGMRNLSALDAETLRLLSEKGFRFAMDGVRDLRIEPRDLADKGIRLIKVPAALMVGRAADTGAAIHVADLSGLFARYGIDLVVEGVETESVVVDLLDYDVKLAQGTLFSPPRPVRAEVMSASEPLGMAAAPRTRAEPRAESRQPAAPQTLGAAALASGAVGREAPRKQGVSQGLRALIRDRS